MKKHIIKSIAPIVLSASILLSACGKKSDCELPTRHVHRYTKEITDYINIEAYYDNEHLKYSGYTWNEDYIEINKEDEKIYQLLGKRGLFDGRSNWDYLYNYMSSKHDYLLYYYYYTTVESYIVTDSDGNTETKIRTVVHEGWHEDKYSYHNTGRVRLCHHRFNGCRIINKDGKLKIESSPLVDDIREVINDYPYFSENCASIVSEDFRFNRYELPNLTVEDFDVFSGPDLSNPNLENDYIMERKK